MIVLNVNEINEVSGGKPKFLNFVFSGLIGMTTGFFVGGPAGAMVGLYTGLAGGGIKEAGLGLVEVLHPELGTSH